MKGTFWKLILDRLLAWNLEFLMDMLYSTHVILDTCYTLYYSNY